MIMDESERVNLVETIREAALALMEDGYSKQDVLNIVEGI